MPKKSGVSSRWEPSIQFTSPAIDLPTTSKTPELMELPVEILIEITQRLGPALRHNISLLTLCELWYDVAKRWFSEPPPHVLWCPLPHEPVVSSTQPFRDLEALMGEYTPSFYHSNTVLDRAFPNYDVKLSRIKDDQLRALESLRIVSQDSITGAYGPGETDDLEPGGNESHSSPFFLIPAWHLCETVAKVTPQLECLPVRTHGVPKAPARVWLPEGEDTAVHVWDGPGERVIGQLAPDKRWDADVEPIEEIIED
ncbi:hypothetical protein B0T26DRAFT_678392 [Lasiosphaeria miniovina]|uniref:F-box domain-containing protein n=1 Tax=Lasiosphaeria miniovina TaxID=1954250 RepID=A0AA40AE39_9PEZI|nr:uncharacterized protein B0T26DRAFT_678392 [Lasiosphaeria miniovina]KAK0714150.1 hypothetical protein B0T26DRAFT_678392 [Lasiosphaeria miniovina]